MKRFSFAILLIFIISLTGCGVTKETVVATEQSTGADTEESIETRIESVEVLSAEKNPNNIWDIRWPYYYCQGGENVQFPDSVSMSDEDMDILLQFYNEYDNDTYKKDKEFLCRVIIGVMSGNTQTGKLIYIYDEYPEGFEDVVDVVNRICGGDKEYLTMTGKIQEITPEYFTAITGIDDSKVYDGTVEEVIEHLNIRDIQDVQWYNKNWTINDVVQNYSLCRYLPYEVKQATSTDVECKEYAEKLAEELGAAGKVTKVYSEHNSGHEWYEIHFKDQVIRVYRSEQVAGDIQEYNGFIDSYYYSLTLKEDTSDYGPLESNLLFDFTYSADAKFIIAVEISYDDKKDYFYEVAQAAERLDTGVNISTVTDATDEQDASEED